MKSSDINNFENPDINCNECGDNEWTLFENSTPRRYPGGRNGSNVERYQYECKNCPGHGRIYKEGVNINPTGRMRYVLDPSLIFNSLILCFILGAYFTDSITSTLLYFLLLHYILY